MFHFVTSCHVMSYRIILCYSISYYPRTPGKPGRRTRGTPRPGATAPRGSAGTGCTTRASPGPPLFCVMFVVCQFIYCIMSCLFRLRFLIYLFVCCFPWSTSRYVCTTPAQVWVLSRRIAGETGPPREPST